MANGVEHLSAVMELLPDVRLSITSDDFETTHAYWIDGQSFAVREAIAIGLDMYLCLSTDEQDLYYFSIGTEHVMGAMAGESINIDDNLAEVIAEHVHHMIESGALLAVE